MKIGRMAKKKIHEFVTYLMGYPAGIFVTRKLLNANPVTFGGLHTDTPHVTIWTHPTSPPPADQSNFVLIPQMEELSLPVEIGDYCFTGAGDIYVCSDATVGALVWDGVAGGAIATDAADVTVTPAGDIAATDVQAALEELDDEKLPVNIGIVSVGSSRDIAVTDSGKILEVTATAALNAPNGLATGLQLVVASIGGTTTITATTTLQYLSGGVQTAASGLTVSKQCTLYHRGSNVWLALGDVTAI